MVRSIGVSHIGYIKRKPMTKTPPSSNRIAELRKDKGFTQQALADAIGSHWITVSKLERGIMRLTDEWRSKIAEALEVDQWDLVVGARLLPQINVEARIYPDGSIELVDPDDNTATARITTQFFTFPGFRWLEVMEDALWPWYQNGDFICVLHIDPDEIKDHVGRLCLIWFKGEDGGEDVAVGMLGNGSRPGVFDLQRSGLMPLRDIVPTDFAVVSMAIYDVARHLPGHS